MRLLFLSGLILFCGGISFASGIYSPGTGSVTINGGSGDNLGSHIATMTVTANYGIVASTISVSTVTLNGQIKFNNRNCLETAPDGTCVLSMPGVQETFFGYSTNIINNGGVFNTSYGSSAMPYPNTGNFNNCIGNSCMSGTLLSGENNNGMGYASLGSLRAGFYNNGVGGSALNLLQDGSQNTAVGGYASNHLVSGSNTTSIGYRALFDNLASDNMGIGFQAGTSSDTANASTNDDHVIFIGTESGRDLVAATTLSNAGAIGWRAYAHKSNSFQMGGQVGSGHEWEVIMASLTVPTGQTTLQGVSYKWPSSQASGTKILSNDGSGNLSWATDATGGGSSLSSTQTWSGQNNWTTPAQSTFTYGVTMGSLTVNGAGDGNITLTISGSTYSVVASSITPIVGHVASWSGTGTLRDGGAGGGSGTPGGTTGQLQYNNAGSLAGVAGSVVTTSSVTLSSITITSNGTITILGPTDVNYIKLSLTDTDATFRFFQSGVNDNLLTLGNTNGLSVNNKFKTTGANNVINTAGSLISASANGGNLSAPGIVDLWSTAGQPSYVSFNETGIANNGTIGFPAGGGPFIFYTGSETFGSGTERLRISPTGGLIVNSSATVLGASGLAVTYGVTAGSVTVTGPLRFFSQTVAQINAITPGAVGETYYCSDCTTVPLALCVSTGTARGAFSSPVSRSTACR